MLHRGALYLGLAVIGMHLAIKEGPNLDKVLEISNYVDKTALFQGKYAPDVKLKLIDGREFSLADEVGKKVVVLNFFATWCSPCVEEVPELNRYYEEHRGESFIIVGVDAGETVETVRFFAEQNRVEYLLGIDEQKRIGKAYGVESYPTTVLIGADGIMHLYEMGFIANADVAFQALVQEHLKIIEEGRGTNARAHLEALAAQGAIGSKGGKKDEDVLLEGRAMEIAASMYCPCGCNDDLMECSCKTARNIKGRLAAMDFTDGRTDEEIIKDLNRLFCKGAK